MKKLYAVFLCMHITIYFNNKPLVLTDKEHEATAKLNSEAGTIVMKAVSDDNITAMIASMQQPKVKAGVFVTDDVMGLLEAFKQKMVFIQAAGGLVHTEDNLLLLIFRKGKWDLPKGKLDEEEALEDCAGREVTEETGLQNITLEEPLTVTYHTYFQDNDLVLKESHWFLMRSSLQLNLTPQTEEDIEKCEWVKPKDLQPYLNNTHPSIIDVLKVGVTKLGATVL